MTVSQDKPLSRRQLRETPRAEDPEISETATPQGAPDEGTPPTYRPRDNRPDGRRSSFAPSFTSANLGEWSPPGRAGQVDAAPRDSAPTAADDAPTTDGTDSTSPVEADRDGWNRPVRSDLDAPERTMTRRELRILRARAEAAGQPAPDVVFGPNGETTVTGAIDILDSPERFTETDAADETPPDAAPEPELVPEADAAGVVTETAEDAVDPAGVETEYAGAEGEIIEDAVVVEEPESVDDASGDGDGAASDQRSAGDSVIEAPEVDAAGIVTEQPAGDEPARADDPAADSMPVIPALIEPEPGESPRFQTDAGQPAEIVVEAEHAPSADDGSPAPGTLRPFDAMFLPPSARDGAESSIDTSSAQLSNDTDGLRGDILAAPDGPAKPFGHWSTQNDDDGPHTDGTLSRDVGVTTGALTTHALVLPSIPDSGEPLLSPLTSTGEVMVTGTIDLPRSFGSTGAHPALFDHPDVDALIDDSDRDDADAGIAPVRASRAVSSSTTTRSMIGTETEKKSRMIPIALIVVIGIVVVAAATVAVFSFMTNQF